MKTLKTSMVAQPSGGDASTLAQYLASEHCDDAVRQYLDATHASNTLRAYRADLKHFMAWGGSVPASPE